MSSEFPFDNLKSLRVPGIVASVYGSEKKCLELARAARGAGATLLEVRADRLESAAEEWPGIFERVKAISEIPLLLTIRQAAEQGSFAGSESQRLELFKTLTPAADVVDVELYASEIRDEVIEFARELGKVVLVSYHDFSPSVESDSQYLDSLNDLLEAGLRCGADILKIAVMANSFADAERLYSFTRRYNMSGSGNMLLSTISMGEWGKVSRILNPFVGSCLTYGFVGDQPNAPGQVSLSALKNFLAPLFSEADSTLKRGRAAKAS